MNLQNTLLCLSVCIAISTCNRVYVHPFNMFAYNKTECEQIEMHHHTIEKTIMPVPIDSQMKYGEDGLKGKAYQRMQDLGSAESYLTTLVNDLGFRAWKEIHSSETIVLSFTNFYWSILSFYLGASGETALDLQKLLGFENPSLESTNCTAQVSSLKVITKLKNIDSFLFSENGNIVISKTVCIFVSPNLPLSENFIHDLEPAADNLHIRAVDFTDSAKAVNSINEFLDARLPKKVRSGLTSVDETSNFMYMSHIDYKGKVSKSFLIPELQQFWIEPDKQISVPMISASGIFQFKDDNVTNQLAVKIPLSENDFFLLVQPTNGNTLENIERFLTSKDWQTLFWRDGFLNRYIKLTVPKLDLENSYDAKDLLNRMDLHFLLGKNAHLGKLNNEDINIGKVINIVHFELEAGGSHEEKVVPENKNNEEPLCININKPFFIALYEGTTKALPLLGKIINPLNQSI